MGVKQVLPVHPLSHVHDVVVMFVHTPTMCWLVEQLVGQREHDSAEDPAEGWNHPTGHDRQVPLDVALHSALRYWPAPQESVQLRHADELLRGWYVFIAQLVQAVVLETDDWYEPALHTTQVGVVVGVHVPTIFWPGWQTCLHAVHDVTVVWLAP